MSARPTWGYAKPSADLPPMTGFNADVPEVSPSGEIHSGQVRMAYRLARAAVDTLLHVKGIGWHRWDGARWAEDEHDQARRAALDVMRDALTESFNTGDKQLRLDVGKCESDAGIRGLLGIAASLVEFAATVADMDADPALLNCANGTLDLRTRTLRDPNPGDRITKVAAGAYLPGLGGGLWDEFLQTVLPDADMRDYLQRVAGQCVYGRVTEHLFPVLTGKGSNGKTTSYGALCHALGDYATVINPSLLLVTERFSNTGGPEMMVLLGARLVVGAETGEGRKLDEAAMKRLTGGDPLTARRLYREPVTWDPGHQLLYVTNLLPKVKGNDPAAWRRIRVIPFAIVIPEADRDPNLPGRLREFADAILTWAVDGWFDYVDNGHRMREPDSVLVATENYHADSDDVRRFTDEACHVGPQSTASTRELYSAWCYWQQAEGAERFTEKAFAAALDALGYPARKVHGVMIRCGLSPYSMASEGES